MRSSRSSALRPQQRPSMSRFPYRDSNLHDRKSHCRVIIISDHFTVTISQGATITLDQSETMNYLCEELPWSVSVLHRAHLFNSVVCWICFYCWDRLSLPNRGRCQAHWPSPRPHERMWSNRGMIATWETEGIGEKPVLVPLCSSQITHKLH
jgi:hypothetical protein